MTQEHADCLKRLQAQIEDAERNGLMVVESVRILNVRGDSSKGWEIRLLAGRVADPEQSLDLVAEFQE